VIRTFVDAGVLIAAVRGNDELAMRAMVVLDDADREFAISPLLKLEVIPQPTYNRRPAEVAFMNAFFDNAHYSTPLSEDLFRIAIEQACLFGLDAVDALHVAAALLVGAEELVSAEKSSKPLCRVKSMKVVTIRPSA
jgi:predicted nucleic acid-binding protein